MAVPVDDVHVGEDVHRAVPQDVYAVEAQEEQVLLPLEASQEENDAHEASQTYTAEKPELLIYVLGHCFPCCPFVVIQMGVQSTRLNTQTGRCNAYTSRKDELPYIMFLERHQEGDFELALAAFLTQ